MGTMTLGWKMRMLPVALPAALLCAASPGAVPPTSTEMNAESAILAATGYHVFSRSEVSGTTGPEYIGPGVGGMGCMSPDPPEENFEEPLRAAAARDRKAVSLASLPTFGATSQRLALVSPTEKHSATAYVTAVPQSPDDVARAYYHGLLARCSGNKLGDARFLVSGVHVQLTDYCGGTGFDIASVLRRVDELVHPRWLVVAECGGGSFVSGPLVRAAGLLPLFDFWSDNPPPTALPQ